MLPLMFLKPPPMCRLLVVLLLLLLPVTAHAICGLPDDLSHQPLYDAALLEKTFACVSTAKNPLNSQTLSDDESALQYAGIWTLLNSDGGLPRAERVQMIYQYGLWLAQTDMDEGEAESFLSVAVRLAPNLALAWLNLGNLYAKEALDRHTQIETVTPLNNLAADSYRKYAALTSSPDPNVLTFLAMHPPFPGAQSVVKFVLDRFNAGGLQSLFVKDGQPVNLLGDGTNYYVYEIYDNDGDPSLVAFRTQQAEPDEPSVQQAPVYFGSGGGPGGDVRLIAYRSRYYVINLTNSSANEAADDPHIGDDNNKQAPKHEWASIDIAVPNFGIIGTISAHAVPALTVGQGVKLCDALLHNKRFDKPLLNPSLAGKEINYHYVVATIKVDLENNSQTRDIAYWSSAFDGVPCDMQGMLLYDSKTMTEHHTKLDEALNSLSRSCIGGQNYLITWQGKTYIEASDSDNTLPGQPDGQGIYVVEDDKISPVCIIRNTLTYSAS